MARRLQPALFETAAPLTCGNGSPWGRYGCGDAHGPCAACVAEVNRDLPPVSREDCRRFETAPALVPEILSGVAR